MGIIFIIIAIVGGVSLYDYFSARRWQQVTSTERNELVFEKRNREYGAYVIRRDYDLRVVLILASIVASIGVAYGVHKIIQNMPEEEIAPPPVDMTQFTMNAPPLDEEVPPPPPEPEIPPMERTIQFIEPEVVDEVVETEVEIVQDQDIKVSTETNETDTETFAVVEKPKEVVVEKPKEDEIPAFVDEEAIFPGGPNAMKQYLASNINYPQSAVELGITGKVYLKFVVGTDGDITNVTVQRGIPDCPECEKEAIRVVRSMPKWTPAKKNGKTSKSYFNLPVTFKIQ